MIINLVSVDHHIEHLQSSTQCELQGYVLARDREMRGDIRAPARYSSYAKIMFTALLAASDVIYSEPVCFTDVINSKDSD